LTAVCDLVEKQREWFRQIPTVKLVTATIRAFGQFRRQRCLRRSHNLHEKIYLDVLKAGKDLLAKAVWHRPKGGSYC
jgi:hypothetical protein